eukprot:jgi/Chlat1/2575/Chrsp175S02416
MTAGVAMHSTPEREVMELKQQHKANGFSIARTDGGSHASAVADPPASPDSGTWTVLATHLPEALSHLQPYVYINDKQRVEAVELFGEYCVRQLGLNSTDSTAPWLCKVAMKYIRGDKSASDTSREHLIRLAENACAETPLDVTDLAADLVAELDACMYSYFGFHWDHADMLLRGTVEQPVLRKGSRPTLKEEVMKATMPQRYQRTLQVLGPQRCFYTIIEELKMIHHGDEVLSPRSEGRPPVLLLLGGGMGAGKSTAVHEIMKSSFWSAHGTNAVVVEADAFKEKDVIYRALTNHSAYNASELVHDTSIQAASSLLVSAINEGRDIIFDGTMSWEPFVRQTIAMARNADKHKYRMGPGYRRMPDNTILERYWEVMDESICNDEADCRLDGKNRPHRPYRIEMVGVTCDAELAVVRGMRRAILTGRTVPVASQLRSHSLFAAKFEAYCDLVDHATLFSTNAAGQVPTIIAKKGKLGHQVLDEAAYTHFRSLAHMNTSATNVAQLHCTGKHDSHGRCACSDYLDRCKGIWADVVLCPSRLERREQIVDAISGLVAPSPAVTPSASMRNVQKMSYEVVSGDVEWPKETAKA